VEKELLGNFDFIGLQIRERRSVKDMVIGASVVRFPLTPAAVPPIYF